MADALDTAGKIAGITGIRSLITGLGLVTSGFISVGDELAVTGTSDFSISSGILVNNSALVFTINVADIGETITQIQYLDTLGDVLINIDLDSPLTIAYAGEATIALGVLRTSL